MITIDNEARLAIRYPFEIDCTANRYKTSTEIYTFTCPSLWTIEKNYFVLLRNSTVKVFDQKYRYKPSYLSFDEYGVTALDYLLMYINQVASVEDFDLVKVIIPSMDSIVTMCQDKFPVLEDSQLERVGW